MRTPLFYSKTPVKALFKSTLLSGFLITGLAYSALGFARNISTEQSNASEARAHYNQAKSDLDRITQQIALQEKIVADATKKLDQLKQAQSEATRTLENAQADLAAKDQILNDVWESRDQK